MHRNLRSLLPLGLSLNLGVLLALLGVIWLAGGASRPDVPGQAVVRGAAWLSLVIAILVVARIDMRPVRAVMFFIAAILASVLLQLFPLPPEMWQAMPGHEMLAQAAIASGEAQPWRPISLSPGATLNAASSLIVPIAVLIFVAGLTDSERSLLPGVLLGVVVASALVGALQFSGAGFANPFVNEDVGDVAGTFANRNHFALFLAVGCLLAPAWAFRDGRRAHWRGSVALALTLLFIVMILASGSRAGILVGVLALALALLLSWHGIRRELRRAPRWALPALIAGILATVAGFVLISIASDRAVSINRAMEIEVGADIRHRSLPTILSMIQEYFPFGSGYGTFDAAFRMHEPFDLLKLTYLNHAHNDFLEIALNGGVLGALLLVAALFWWAVASFRAWRPSAGPSRMLPRLGSAVLFLVFVASAFDYPARTPLIMMVVVIAATWLNGISFTPERAASIADGNPSFVPRDPQAHA